MTLGKEGRKHRILLIDDVLPERELFGEILRNQGYAVLASGSAAEALAAVAKMAPDLIVLDMSICAPDGSELCQKLKEQEFAGDVPIIFISAGNSRADRIAAFSAGGVDYLARPIEPQEALARIANHLSFRDLRCTLEQRVHERTAELEAANLRLIQEISGRRAAEESLNQRNALINCLIDANIIGIMFVRSDGCLLDANTAFLELFSLDRNDVLAGKIHWQDLVAEENASTTSEAFAQIAETGRCPPYEKLCVDTQGKHIPILIGSAKLPNAETCISFVLNLSERKQIEEHLRASKRSLREVLARNVSNIEAERKRIAREIHDEQGSLLTAIKLDLSLLRLELGEMSEKLTERFAHLLHLTDDTIRVMRQIATQLRPAALNLGLLPSLEWLVSDFRRRTGIECSFLAPNEIEVAEEQAAALFRVVQESLTNVLRHAAAKRVQVMLTVNDGLLRLSVSDDGRGFDPAVTSQACLGLRGISERLEIVGGKFAIDSSPGKGTTLSIYLMLERGKQ